MTDERPTWRPPDQPAQPGFPPAGSGQPMPAPPASGEPGLPQSPGPGWAPPPGAQQAPYGYGYAPPPPPRRRSRRGVYIAVGLVVALIVAVVALGFVLGDSLGKLADLGQRTPIEEVAVGECFDGIRSTTGEDAEELPVGMLFGVEVIDCAEEHEAEMMGRTSWPAERGDEYPGNEEIETFAFNECVEIFGDYVGRSFFDSTLELTYTFPRQASWNEGSRGIECIAHPPAGIDKEAGSVRGSGR